MNDEKTAVEERIRGLAGEARAETLTLPVELIRSRARPHATRRRWVVATAAAVLVVGALGAFAGLQLTEDTTDRVDAGPAQGVEAPEHYVPSQWPDFLDGPVKRIEFIHDWAATSWLLSESGEPKVIATRANWPLLGSGEPPGGTYTLHGTRVLWEELEGLNSLRLEVLPGRTVDLRSRTVGRSAMEELAGAFDSDGLPQPARLPAGWSVTPDDVGVAEFFDAGWSSEWEGVQRSEESTGSQQQRMLTVASRAQTDAADVVEQVAALSGPQARRVPVGANSAIVVELPAPNPGQEMFMIVWAPAADRLATVRSIGISLEDALPVAESVRPVDDDTWSRIPVGGGKGETRVVDGFKVPVNEEVIESGQQGEFRWMVTLGQFDRPESLDWPGPESEAPPDDQTTISLYATRDNGPEARTDIGPLDMEHAGYGTTATRHSDMIVFGSLVPAGITDANMTVNGEAHEPVMVPIDSQYSVAFVLIPAEQMPDLSRIATEFTGTLPDGTPYRL
jgi:hypothetical protein